MSTDIIKQGTPAWLEARRSLITATDLPVILGLSPYKCEADLADEKAGKAQEPPSLRMRAGLILEGLIAEAYTEQTGRQVIPFGSLETHPDIPWAGATPDYRTMPYEPHSEWRIVECKRTSSRSRFADGLPQDIEAQVVWQLGVTGYPVADVAALIGDDRLEVFTVEANPSLFADLVAVAEDFRRRLEAGGPFARDNARIRRDHPVDDGTEIIADGDLEEAVEALVAVRHSIKAQKELEGALVERITTRMGPAAILRGSGWHATWKASRAPVITNWEGIATGFLKTLPETERETLVGLHQTVGKAQRPFRVWMDKETE
jgi:putative phage-type endonuclease